MSKFLALGMSLEFVLQTTDSRPHLVLNTAWGCVGDLLNAIEYQLFIRSSRYFVTIGYGDIQRLVGQFCLGFEIF